MCNLAPFHPLLLFPLVTNSRPPPPTLPAPPHCSRSAWHENTVSPGSPKSWAWQLRDAIRIYTSIRCLTFSFRNNRKKKKLRSRRDFRTLNPPSCSTRLRTLIRACGASWLQARLAEASPHKANKTMQAVTLAAPHSCHRLISCHWFNALSSNLILIFSEHVTLLRSSPGKGQPLMTGWCPGSDWANKTSHMMHYLIRVMCNTESLDNSSSRGDGVLWDPQLMSEMIYKVLEIPSRPPTPVKLNPILGKTKFCCWRIKMMRDNNVLTVSCPRQATIMTERTVKPTAWGRVYTAVWCCHILTTAWKPLLQADYRVLAAQTSNNQRWHLKAPLT